MFKRGVITDEISQDIEKAASLAKKYGLTGLEIRSVWEKGPHELEESDIQKIKETMNEYGLECCGISAPFYKCNIDSEEEVRANIDILHKCIHLAKELGTKYIRGFTFWKKGELSDYIDKIVERYQEPIRIAEENDIYILLEFDPSVFATNAKTLTQVLKAINSPRVKGLWDPGNDIYEPDGEIPFPDGYNIIKDYFVHMHIKDAAKKADGTIEGVPFGEGQVDFEGQFKALVESGYDGYCVMETHYRPKHEISEELLALPKGSAFSMYGYEATEECLIKWNALLDKLGIAY